MSDGLSGVRSVACFMLRVKPELIDEYRARHSPVWPEMLRAIRDAGWSNYTIFLRDDGTVVGYFEADDVTQARLRLESTDVSAQWDAATSNLFAETQQWLTPVFDLDRQLREIDERATTATPSHPEGNAQ